MEKKQGSGSAGRWLILVANAAMVNAATARTLWSYIARGQLHPERLAWAALAIVLSTVPLLACLGWGLRRTRAKAHATGQAFVSGLLISLLGIVLAFQAMNAYWSARVFQFGLLTNERYGLDALIADLSWHIERFPEGTTKFLLGWAVPLQNSPWLAFFGWAVGNGLAFIVYAKSLDDSRHKY